MQAYRLRVLGLALQRLSPAARRSTRQSERWFNSATYVAAEFVIGRLQRLLFVVGFTYCVIFATLQNLFFTAMVQRDFFGWMSRIYYRWGVAS
jgi:hypothetical protein